MVNSRKYLGISPRYFLIIAAIIATSLVVIFVIKPNDLAQITNNSKQKVDTNCGNTVILPNDMIVKSKIDDDLIIIDNNAKNIFAYNIITHTYRSINSVNNKNYFFKTITANSKWIVWVEDDKLINDVSEGSKWQLVAYNINTNELQVVEKSDIKPSNYEAPEFINIVPDKIEISNENNITYILNTPNESTISSHLILYDLNNKSKKTIASTEDINKEWLYDCSIYGDIIVWNKLINRNFDNQFRMSNYKYSNLYLYKIETGEIEQLTDKDFYYSPQIYNNMLVTIRMPLTKPNQVTSNTEVALMNINDNTIYTIVDENSEVYKTKEDQMLRERPIINSKYISWYANTGDNMFVYNYLNKEFVRVYDDNDDDPANITTVWTMFDDYALINVNRIDEETRKLLVKLPD
jgi:hypothetical protein